jgi:hypothetical protein
MRRRLTSSTRAPAVHVTCAGSQASLFTLRRWYVAVVPLWMRARGPIPIDRSTIASISTRTSS